MESVSWIWQVGAGMLAGLAVCLGAWSAAVRSDRRSVADDNRRNGNAVTSPLHHKAHTAPTPRG
jgi:hypothetical protein